ncbi:MAG: primosomal protein N' [Chlamydiales bacterium]|nr:primosomal protein N' [Chlamydiales bacterium]
MSFASVLLDDGIDKPLDYKIPQEITGCGIGMRVMVPLRGRPKPGTIITLKETPEIANVQSILKLLSEKPAISPALFTLAEWMSRYYCTPMRRVLKVMTPPGMRKDAKKRTQLFITSLLSRPELASKCEEIRGKYPQQAQALDALLMHPKGLLLTDLLEKAQISNSPLQTLIKKKILHAEAIASERSPIDEQEVFATKPKELKGEQAEALQKISSSLHSGEFAAHLLFGVTGSGKTEVYIQAMEQALSLGKGVIFLVPEILLTSQTLERVRTRFSEKIALIHHRLSDGERHDTWRKIQDGTIRIVMGARSAIFSPMPDLGLIIVDEEHESAFKQQEEQPSYHAREVALMRAKIEKATVVLGSATPSLESYQNALQGKYQLSILSSRAEQSALAPVVLVDMRLEFAKAKGFTLFSERLIEAIKKRCRLGEQAILLLNRRGYHTSCLCASCGYIARCPNCDLALTYHLGEKILACHLCDHRLTPLRSCPECKAEETIKFKGAGTEMAERALHAVLPEVRTLRMDADTTRHKGSHELIFRQFRSGKADVLIGTQMVAKGLHLPSVTLVGVLNADSSLNIPDFRAQEKSFQLLTQVAGRAGRAELEGEVIVQTHMPEHDTMRLATAQNYEAFFQEELEVRKLFNFPPFSHLAKVVFSGSSQAKTQEALERFRSTLITNLPPSFQLMPVVACGHPKIQTRYRFQFLIKGSSPTLLSQKLKLTQQQLPPPPGDIRTLIDINPETTFF